MTDTPLYPHVRVTLTGRDGNAFVIIGTVSAALRRAGAPPQEVLRFREEAFSGDYDNVLRTVMKWVTAL